MPLFKPFGFYKPKVEPAVPGWTPADFTNVQYWWTADAGITESGGVTQWTDQINSYVLEYGQGVTSGTKPTLTTSATLNGANVVSFNGTSDFLYATTQPASFAGNDLTMLGVYNLIDVKTGGMMMGVVFLGNATRFYVDVFSGLRILHENIASSGLTITTPENPATTGASAMKLRYDASAGDGFYAKDTLTETSLGTSGDINADWTYSSTTVAMGALIRNTNGEVFGGRYVQYEMAEEVIIYGTPTTDEMNDWKTYVNNKYGTIIS